MNLEDLRKQIDELDIQIVKLIAERMTVTRDIGQEKKEAGKPMEDKARELAVLEKSKNLARAENLNPEEIEKIYQKYFLLSKESRGLR